MASEEVSQAVEEWRDVVGFEGLYEVSNTGRVRSLDRTVRFGNNTRYVKGRVLKPYLDGHGYKVVSLSNGVDITARKKVHRLVAEAFVDNPDNLKVVDHINCDKTDNHAENLRFCTIKQNTRWARENGLIPPPNKEVIEKTRARTVRPVIRDDGKRYESVKAAADDLGVTDNAIHHVLHGRHFHRACKGHTFRYEDEGFNKPKEREKSARHVVQIDPVSKDVIRVFDSSEVAMRETGFSSIAHVLRGACRLAGGYMWEYAS